MRDWWESKKNPAYCKTRKEIYIHDFTENLSQSVVEKNPGKREIAAKSDIDFVCRTSLDFFFPQENKRKLFHMRLLKTHENALNSSTSTTTHQSIYLISFYAFCWHRFFFFLSLFHSFVWWFFFHYECFSFVSICLFDSRMVYTPLAHCLLPSRR